MVIKVMYKCWWHGRIYSKKWMYKTALIYYKFLLNLIIIFLNEIAFIIWTSKVNYPKKMVKTLIEHLKEQ